MKVLQIASGSKGNCTYIEQNNTKILLDCGVSKKRVVEALDSNGIKLDNLTAILITHEHTDHTSCLGIIQNAYNCPIYMTRGTYDGLSSKIKDRLDLNYIKFIKNDESFKLEDIEIDVLQLFHDALDPVGYVLKNNNKKLVYITDTGYVHFSLYNKITNADCYIFESNHDPELLMESDRPYETKMRILSDHGHLSNQDSAYVLTNIIGINTKRIIYAHISEECNLLQIVKLTSKRVFKDIGISTDDIKFEYATQIPLEVFEL